MQQGVQQVKYQEIAIGDLIPSARNARTHSEAQIKKIAASISRFKFINPVIIDGEKGIIAGHGRVLAAEMLGLKKIPCILATHLSAAEKRAYMLADNRIQLESGWDEPLLRVELAELAGMDFDLSLTGFDDFEIDDFLNPKKPSEDFGKAGSLAEKFIVPPFSVLNAREGFWQDRKRAWLAKGIKSEIGRGDNLLQMSDACNNGGYGKAADAKAKGKGKTFGTEGNISGASGTSIFDPVLCELAYSWFCPPAGEILDPFAGGSVRGVVASLLGRQYCGIDLRKEQIDANKDQGKAICAKEKYKPLWVHGDSRDIQRLAEFKAADFIFSCPPYADLEVYSDDPADLSTLEYPAFREAYFDIIKKSCEMLKDDRFACFVVGEVRGKDGAYYDFVGDTVQAFRDAGLKFYNEAILITAAGSLPIRAGKQFSATRKLGKTHQNVLVFLKGDAKKAVAACGNVQIALPDDGAESNP